MSEQSRALGYEDGYKDFYFYPEIKGSGLDAEEAWLNAVEALSEDPGDPPEASESPLAGGEEGITWTAQDSVEQFGSAMTVLSVQIAFSAPQKDSDGRKLEAAVKRAIAKAYASGDLLSGCSSKDLQDIYVDLLPEISDLEEDI